MASQQATTQLTADAVLRTARNSLTAAAASSENSSSGQSLLAPADVATLVLHAAMLTAGFRLVALSESDSPLDAEVTAANAQDLPPAWNHSGSAHGAAASSSASRGAYAFKYKHTQSSLTFLLKTTVMSRTLMVHAMGIEDGKIATMDIRMEDYLTSDAMDTSQYPMAAPDISKLLKRDKVDDLLYSFKIGVIQKLIPGLGKEGYEEAQTANQQADQASRQHAPYNNDRSRNAPPERRPLFDPYIGPLGPTVPVGISPYSVGHNDLDPLGGMRPLGPTPFGGDFGNRGYPGLGGSSSGGGMFVGPDHPMFQGPGGAFGGIQGGDGVLPRGAVPPGARFDPIVPGQVPGSAGLGGPRGMTGGGPGRQLRSGEPDPDNLPPPGYNDMFM
ncbi:hypothetical protein RI367_002099 [Sorochytrium milnesiophthora]